MDRKFLFQSSEIFYRTEGSGQPIVLLHGFAEDHRIWYHQLAYLKKNFKLIVPDLPGSGLSQVIEDMSMEGVADSIKALLDYEIALGNLETPACVTLIGHSMGGYISLAFAEKFPDSVKSLGLFHSTAYPDNEEKKIARRKSIELIRKYGSYPFLQQAIPPLFSEKSKKQSPELIIGLIERYAGFNPESLIAYYNSMINRPDRTDLLKKTSKPVLFVLGKEDKAVPLDHGLQQSHLPSLSYIHILENSAHMGMLEEPDYTNSILNDFADRQ